MDRPQHPIWALMKRDRYTKAWLARACGVSEQHVYCVQAGYWAAGPRFQEAAAKALGLPVAVLFSEEANRWARENCRQRRRREREKEAASA